MSCRATTPIVQRLARHDRLRSHQRTPLSSPAPRLRRVRIAAARGSAVSVVYAVLQARPHTGAAPPASSPAVAAGMRGGCARLEFATDSLRLPGQSNAQKIRTRARRDAVGNAGAGRAVVDVRSAHRGGYRQRCRHHAMSGAAGAGRAVPHRRGAIRHASVGARTHRPFGPGTPRRAAGRDIRRFDSAGQLRRARCSAGRGRSQPRRFPRPLAARRCSKYRRGRS